MDEVILMAKEGIPDVILMDVSLANSFYQGKAVDGIKITQILKQDSNTKHIPVILVTAHAMQGDKESFFSRKWRRWVYF